MFSSIVTPVALSSLFPVVVFYLDFGCSVKGVPLEPCHDKLAARIIFIANKFCLDIESGFDIVFGGSVNYPQHEAVGFLKFIQEL